MGSLFGLSVWDYFIDYIGYLSTFMGFYTGYFVVFLALVFALIMVKFILRLIRLR